MQAACVRAIFADEMVDADDELLRQGYVVATRYRLVAPLGEGGMGAVWRATHLSLGSAVALKFLHGAVAGSDEARARFDREAKVSAQLAEGSQHIAKVIDHGVLENGRPFLAMELLVGESLHQRLDREGRLPLPVASTILTQLCRALHKAHAAGVIHRDLKPANVFLCRGEDGGVFVKLLDFGVAKATLQLDAIPVTRAGFVVGTPSYMSPEQITGERLLDARSDLWAVAAIAYGMSVGAPPFGSGTLQQLGARITREEPKPPSVVVPGLPGELDEFVRKGLAKARDRRFQTTHDLVEAFQRVATRAGPTIATPLPATVDDLPTEVESRAFGARPTNAPARPSLPSDDGSIEEWRPPRSYGLAILVVALVVLVGGLATFLVVTARANLADPRGGASDAASGAEIGQHD